jgi:hypothetical protein
VAVFKVLTIEATNVLLPFLDQLNLQCHNLKFPSVLHPRFVEANEA